MNNRFDELAKGLAQSVTRRQAFKRFSVGLAGMAVGCLGLGNRAEASNTECKGCVATCKKFGGTNCVDYCRSIGAC